MLPERNGKAGQEWPLNGEEKAGKSAHKKSSHRWGRNLWKPWSRDLLAPMVFIIPETVRNAKIFQEKMREFPAKKLGRVVKAKLPNLFRMKAFAGRVVGGLPSEQTAAISEVRTPVEIPFVEVLSDAAC